MSNTNQVANTSTTNIVPVQALFDNNGNCLGLVGPGGQFFSPPLTADVINGATINSSSLGATTPSTVNATVLSVGGCGCMYSTLPTLGSGWGTGATITASNTSAFKITIGTGGSAGGTINFPASTTGWVIQAWDITGANTLFLQQSGSTTTSASLTSFGITTGLPANMTAGDMILVMAMAF